MAERSVQANGVELWTEAFGNPQDTPFLLIMGASVQSIFWPQELIDALVASNCYVIRYDNRDTGQSQCFDFATSPYSLDDMALDAVGVLDAYGIDSAHVCGLSMGGMIAQLLMINHRSRIRSAVLFMTSPLSGGGGTTEADSGSGDVSDGPVLMGAADLPGPDPQWVAKAIEWSALPEESIDDRIHKRVESLAMMVGPAQTFDADHARSLAVREVKRARQYSAMNNHPLAIAASQPADRRELLRAVDVPTLVIHGTADPILPYAHGQSLAGVIPNAWFKTFDGIGHDTAQLPLQEIAAQMVELQTPV